MLIIYLQVDTGSYRQFTYDLAVNRSFYYENTSVCMGLSLDDTSLQFISLPGIECETQNQQLIIGGASAFSNATTAPAQYIQNDQLHEWQHSNGVIGASYCQQNSHYDCDQLTSFQKLVQNSTSEQDLATANETLVFGLDFRTDSSPDKYTFPTNVDGSNSAMQLGGVDAAYVDSIVWMRQVATKPAYHEFMIENVQFCGTSVLGNYSTNWPVMVDTGSVCLTLPGEIYDSFAAWFDNSTVIEDVNSMPAFSFQVRNGERAATAYIPLSDLLLNVSAIEAEDGAPYVSLRDAVDDNMLLPRRLCVLRGSDITYRSGGEVVYYSPPPQIILGSLAIQSVYFAADFAQPSVGIANKLSEAYIAGFDADHRVGCAAPAVCFGHQYFIYSENRCHNPDCRRYFFTELDESTMKCKYNQSNLTGGLIFLVLIIVAEVVAYFVTQYSAYSSLEPGRLATIDPLTKHTGMGLSFLVDLVLVYVLKWVPSRPGAVAAGEGITLRQHVNAD